MTDDLAADLQERARFFASLTNLGPPSAPAQPAAVAAGSAEERLRAIREDLGDCQRCKLAPGRKRIVFGQGSPNARLMFVGEAPGADEDEQGLAFVGRAGQLLTDIIEKGLKMPRRDVWIGNVIKCLKYNALVRLEGGKWERIGRLVAKRYPGRVMSVDDCGRIVPKRVIGWYASPLAGRDVYKLSYASSARRGRERSGTLLTGDHPVLTRGGWISVAELTPEDEIAVGDGFSRVAREVLIGSLLGDATIARASAHVQIIHCSAQADYVVLKARALGELGATIREGRSRAQPGGREFPTVTCRTRASRALRVLRNRFYPGGVKRVPSNLELTPRMAAVWFLDDGYTRVKSESSALSEIAAHAFVDDGLPLLTQRLRDDLGIEAYERDTSRGRIHFGSESTLRLSALAAPFCPPSLRYKLHPQIRDRVAFHPRSYEPDEPQTEFDRVVVERVDHDGHHKTFYCIDVEDTHNFVASGGVVHNCRPPQNRNPEPDEILSCQPFLEAQIDAIHPKVIVALGKFGAQWLLKTMEPISRLRGRVGDYKGIAVVPTFHPAYLLRNPGAKRDVWADMKVVLSLLEEG